jgi:small subunit ribosomal protein S20
MANLKSSIKDIRRTERRTAMNRRVKSRLKTLRKNVLAALQSDGDVETKTESVRVYTSALDKAAKRNVIHKNKADREKSKFATKLK